MTPMTPMTPVPPGGSSVTPVPPVLAEAVVRSRDGRSILERNAGGSEPAKNFRADPDHLHTTVTTLEDNGLTVSGFDRVTVVFSGPPEAFAAVFGVQLVHSDASGAGQGAPGWRLAGGSGATSFDVAAGSMLGSAVHRVWLRPPPEAGARSTGTGRLFGAQGEAYHRNDFLLGEVRTTTTTAMPPRLQNKHGPVVRNPDEALAATRATFAQWSDDEFWTRITALIEANPRREDRPPPVGAMITEFGFPDTVVPGFENLSGRPMRADSVLGGHVPADGAPGGPNPYEHPDDWASATEFGYATEFAEKFEPARRRFDTARAALTAEVRTWLPIGATTGSRDTSTLIGLSHEVKACLDVLAGLVTRLDFPAGTGWFTEADWDLLTDAFSVMNDLLSPSTATAGESRAKRVGTALIFWHRIAERLLRLESCFPQAESVVEQARQRVLDKWAVHGTMAAYAFLAVAGDAVDLKLVTSAVPLYQSWPHDPGHSGRMVLSCSYGARADGGLDTVDLVQRRAAWSARWSDAERESQLYVLVVGNEPDDADDEDSDDEDGSGFTDPADLDLPMNTCSYAAEDNVLIVGGCHPSPENATDWEAADATHGYATTITTNGRATPILVPHVCATTKGSSGGAVVFPAAPPAGSPSDVPQRWWTASGSSLSTPIVAAVCALVWAACPALPAKLLKRAVLASAADLMEEGQFHKPESPRAGALVDGSNLAADHGAGRVMLAAALERAQEWERPFIAGRLRLLADARGREPTS